MDVAPGRRSQRVDGVGFTPVAALVWWSAGGEEGRVDGCEGGLGFVASNQSRAVAWRALNGVESTVADSATANTAVVLPDSLGRARFTGAADGFALDWDHPPEAPLLAQYLVLGGELDAAVGSITCRAGETARVRLAFAADVVFVAAAGRRDALLASFGAAVGGRQACTSFFYPAGAPPDAVVGAQCEGAVAAVPRADRSAFASLAHVIRAGDGELDVTCDGDDDVELHYLALAGLQCRLGVGLSPPSPGVVGRRIGFRPKAVLVCSWGLAPSEQPRDIGRISFGAATSPAATRATAWFARDVPAPVTKTGTAASMSRLLLVPDTQREATHASMTLDAIDRHGFSSSWSGADEYRRQFFYVALGDPARLRSLQVFVAFVDRLRSIVSATARRRRAARSR